MATGAGSPSRSPCKFERKIQILGLPPPSSPAATFYTLSRDISVLRKFVSPSTDAHTRAGEIVSAFEEWCATRRPIRDQRAAEYQMDAAAVIALHLEDQVIKMPARTLDGMLAKARSLAVCFTLPGTKVLIPWHCDDLGC
jgi:hypothetical protein